jgi:hypothetical protein
LLAIEEVTEKELKDNRDQGLGIKRNEEKTKGVL